MFSIKRSFVFCLQFGALRALLCVITFSSLTGDPLLKDHKVLEQINEDSLRPKSKLANKDFSPERKSPSLITEIAE
jgi:hypothetical protein